MQGGELGALLACEKVDCKSPSFSLLVIMGGRGATVGAVEFTGRGRTKSTTSCGERGGPGA